MTPAHAGWLLDSGLPAGCHAPMCAQHAGLLWLLVLALGCARGRPDATQGADASPTLAQASMTPEKDAQVAAEAWLAHVDAGNYGQSWIEAAESFKKRIDQPGWKKALDGVRAPLGKTQSRTLKSAKYATSLPGAPDGEYVVLQFDTVFERKREAVETVTPAKEADGRWRVSGYFIK
jgi:hypothetical protein